MLHKTDNKEILSVTETELISFISSPSVIRTGQAISLGQLSVPTSGTATDVAILRLFNVAASVAELQR